MKFIVPLRVLAVSFPLAVAACSGDDTASGTTSGTGGATGGTGASGATGATGTTGATSTTGTAGSGSTVAATTSGSAGTGGAGGSGGTAGGTSGSGGRGGASGAAGSGGGATDGGGTGGGGDGSASPLTNFFVSSDTSPDANLGGLVGADQRCQRLATAVGLGGKTWHAYLSAANPATNARDRIGEGPYYNVSGVMMAATKDALHAINGNAALFITERGARVNGQWAGSPGPLEHDVLTGTNIDGTLAANLTCGDWTATTGNSQVGHTDGLGPQMSTDIRYIHWQSSHTGMCGDTGPGGGAGRIYCFVAP